jgi:hypothetical protein
VPAGSDAELQEDLVQVVLELRAAFAAAFSAHVAEAGFLDPRSHTRTAGTRSPVMLLVPPPTSEIVLSKNEDRAYAQWCFPINFPELLIPR